MQVSKRQRRALTAICDGFAPGLDGLPSASALGVPDEFLGALERHIRPAQRRQLMLLLSLWDFVSPRFSSQSPEARERVLRAWRDSRIAQKRMAYKVFRKGALTHYFGLPGEPRAALGYPGPLAAGPRALPFEPERPAADLELDCDVCVIGSGAGGGTAAGVLAAAGLEVVVLEAGGPAAVHAEELDALRALYLDGATSASADQSVDFLAGACLGGGTWVNWTTSLRPPEEVLAEWAALGVARDELERSLDAVSERFDVNEEQHEASVRDRMLERGLRALGWHVAAQPRNARGCDEGGVCGYCGFGCALGAKRSTVETWLADAVRAGARVLVGTRAERVVVERGAATGVEARAGDAHVRVRARAVVAACGAVHTPALLVRSGLENASVGRNLHMHPVTLVAGEFDEEIRPWEGSLQSRYSDEHARLDGGYGVRYETPPVHPGLFGAALPWDGARASLDLIRRYAHVVPVFPLLRDRDGGEIKVDRAGEPVVHYRLSPYDLSHLRAGFAGAARILEAAGARRIVSTHARPVEWEPGRGGTDGFLAEADARGWEPNRVLIASAHLMGTARTGASPAASACNPVGESWEVANLVVGDGSLFPSASGVNPMLTIAALAYTNAQALAARLA
ncbi:MAG: GMC family oxidoreductase N-terminal domain-containing protein [Gaiellaceae bacterium]